MISNTMAKGANAVAGPAAGAVAKGAAEYAMAPNNSQSGTQDAVNALAAAVPGGKQIAGAAATAEKAIAKAGPELEKMAAKVGPEVMAAAEQAIPATATAAKAFAAKGIQIAKQAWQAVKGQASKAVQGAEELGAQGVQAAKGAVQGAEKAVAGAAQSAEKAVAQGADKFASGLSQAKDWVTKKAGEMVPTDAASAASAVSGAAKNLNRLKTGGNIISLLQNGWQANQILDQYPEAKDLAGQLLQKGVNDPHLARDLTIIAGTALTGAAAVKRAGGVKNVVNQVKGAAQQAQAGTAPATAPSTAPAQAPAAQPQEKYLSRDAFRAQTKQGKYQPPKQVKPGQEPAAASQPSRQQPQQPQQQAPTSAPTTSAPTTSAPSSNAGHSQSLKKGSAQPVKSNKGMSGGGRTTRRGNTKIKSKGRIREEIDESIDLERLKNLAGIRKDDN